MVTNDCHLDIFFQRICLATEMGGGNGDLWGSTTRHGFSARSRALKVSRSFWR